jgi:hypothetical protein
MTTNAQALQALTIARKHANNGAEMQSSAQSCINDAQNCLLAGRPDNAIFWAKESLAYSVGVFSSDYQRVNTMLARDLP